MLGRVKAPQGAAQIEAVEGGAWKPPDRPTLSFDGIFQKTEGEGHTQAGLISLELFEHLALCL